MNRSLLIPRLMLLTACADEQTRKAELALQEGNARYQQGRFVPAMDAYADGLHDGRVQHNSGKAAYRAGEWHKAVEHLGSATGMFSDTVHLASAWHDLGNARLKQAQWADSMALALAAQLAEPAPASADIADRVRLALVRDSLRTERSRLVHLTDSALQVGEKAYRQALRLAPTDEDTRFNLVLARRLIASQRKDKGSEKEPDKRQQELSERARQLMQQADELVEAYRFKEALELLQRGLKEEPSLAREEQYINKLNVVTQAAEAQ
jgi:tetratricopeptide (TPR) repeat protein